MRWETLNVYQQVYTLGIKSCDQQKIKKANSFCKNWKNFFEFQKTLAFQFAFQDCFALRHPFHSETDVFKFAEKKQKLDLDSKPQLLDRLRWIGRRDWPHGGASGTSEPARQGPRKSRSTSFSTATTTMTSSSPPPRSADARPTRLIRNPRVLNSWCQLRADLQQGLRTTSASRPRFSLKTPLPPSLSRYY